MVGEPPRVRTGERRPPNASLGISTSKLNMSAPCARAERIPAGAAAQLLQGSEIGAVCQQRRPLPPPFSKLTKIERHQCVAHDQRLHRGREPEPRARRILQAEVNIEALTSQNDLADPVQHFIVQLHQLSMFSSEARQAEEMVV